MLALDRLEIGRQGKGIDFDLVRQRWNEISGRERQGHRDSVELVHENLLPSDFHVGQRSARNANAIRELLLIHLESPAANSDAIADLGIN